MKGHGPVAEYEREGNNSVKWHQGQGQYANYRWYSDVSVDNFNAVLYGYGVYYDLAADDEQKRFIAKDVDRLMTNLLDNHCQIIDLDGEPTEWGRIGRDPDAPQGQTDRVRESAGWIEGNAKRRAEFAASGADALARSPHCVPRHGKGPLSQHVSPGDRAIQTRPERRC